LSSSDNPQFDPQPRVTAEALPSAADPFPPLSAGSPAPVSPPVENPVWSGWDVLLIVALTVVAMVVLQFGFVLADQRLHHPHLTFADALLNVTE
jgi:hypothetical protein